MARRSQHLSAICLPISPDRLESELAANDGTSLLSSYTEAGPRPGVSVPTSNLARLAPQISGSQSPDLELVVLSSGAPVLLEEGACQLGYRVAGTANTKIRGWTAPNWLQYVTFAKWTSSDTYDVKCCAITDTQNLCVIYHDGTNSRYARTFHPRTHTWDSAVEIRTSGDESDVIVCFPDGRLVATAVNRAYRSDDGGTTWTLHSAGVFSSDLTDARSTHTQARAAASSYDRSVVYVAAVGEVVTQCASDDQLASLVQVDRASVGNRPCVVALPGGGYLVGYLRTADDYVVVRRLGSAWDQFSDASTVVVVSAACDDFTLTCDPDGIVWCHYTPTAPGGTVKVSVTVDSGDTWTALDEGALRSLATGDDLVMGMSSASVCGRVYLVGNSVGSTGTVDGAAIVLGLGGWHTLPAAIPGWSTARDWTQRSGTGPSTGSASNATWAPVEKPGDNGWTATGTGTDTLITPGYLEIVTATDTRYFSRATSTTQTPATCSAELICVSGGNVGDDQLILRRWISWVGHEYRLTLRISTTQLRAVDDAGPTTLATASYDTTAAFQVMMLVGSGSNSQVWYKRPEETTWTSLWSGTLADNTATPTATGGIEWGSRAVTITTSRWAFVTDSDSSVVGQGLETTPAVGRPISSIPIPLPHDTGVTSEGPAWLAATGGPGLLGEQYDVDAEHDYPIEHVIPTISPSPAERWRSTSTAEQIIAWDHTLETFTGDSIALVVLDANFRQAVLEHYTGGAWTTTGTLDLATGFTGLGATLSGDTLVPASGGAGTRYIAENELAGGHVQFITGSLGRRIVSNTPGTWSVTGGTAQRPRLILGGVTGTENTGGGVNICAPGGVMVVHHTSAVAYRRWRVRIPASQITPQAFYRAGWIYPMAVRALGAPPEWGWSREAAPNADTRRSRYGTTRVRELGPPLRTWTFAWPSGLTLRGLRYAATTVPDYEGTSAGMPLASAEDVPWALEGLLELSQSGAVPCVALAALPATGVTLTDRSLFLPGRFTSSIRQDHVAGTEGDDEIVRVAEIVIEGVV